MDEGASVSLVEGDECRAEDGEEGSVHEPRSAGGEDSGDCLTASKHNASHSDEYE